MHTIYIVFTLLFGSVLGSFTNVLIARLPRSETITGRSHCPDCGTELGVLDLVPVLSYLVLRARCRYCGVGIPVRYPIVEALGALLMLSAYMRFGADIGALVISGVYVVFVLSVFFIDFTHAIVPNSLTYPVGIMALALAVAGHHMSPPLGSALLGMLIGGGVFLAMLLLTGGAGMGMGDVKLVAVMGLVLGPLKLLPAVLIAALSALAFYGVVALLYRSKIGELESFEIHMDQEDEPEITDRFLGVMMINGKPALPFGSFLGIGLWIAILIGSTLAETWMRISQIQLG